MSLPTIVLIATIALTLIGVVGALAAYLRASGPRTMTAWIGFTLLPFGLWLTGVMDLLGNGIDSLVDWARRVTLEPMVIAGLSLLGLGVLLLLISRVIRRRDSESRKAARAGRRPRVEGGAQTGGALPQGREAQSTPAPKAAATSDEDDEIEALLRKRGIE